MGSGGWGVSSLMECSLVQECPEGPISVRANSSVVRWKKRCGADQAASTELKGLLKRCNVIKWTVSDPLAWNGSTTPTPFSQWAAMSFVREGGSEVMWKDLLCTYCAHCLCKPVISRGIKFLPRYKSLVTMGYSYLRKSVHQSNYIEN